MIPKICENIFLRETVLFLLKFQPVESNHHFRRKKAIKIGPDSVMTLNFKQALILQLFLPYNYKS